MSALDIRCPDGCGEHFPIDISADQAQALRDITETEATQLLIERAMTVGSRLIDALITHKIYDCSALSPLLGDPQTGAAPPSEGAAPEDEEGPTPPPRPPAPPRPQH